MLLKGKMNSYSDKIFDVVNVLLMVVLVVVFAWPLWFVLISSFSDPFEVTMGNVLLFPKGLTLDSYKAMMKYSQILTGYANSLYYTVVGTGINMVLSICCAYPISRKDFPLRKPLLLMFLFTMYFSGGMIPTYLVVKQVGILNTRWAMMLPGAISVYNCLVMRNYFMNSIPGELEEAAVLDGANAAQYLQKVVLPLSKPVLAVIGLYYAVGHWNAYYAALLYLQDLDLYPLQSILRNIMSATQMINDPSLSAEEIDAMVRLEMTMKYSVIVAAAFPMLCLYPFIQKYFVKGVMVGAVKG